MWSGLLILRATVDGVLPQKREQASALLQMLQVERTHFENVASTIDRKMNPNPDRFKIILKPLDLRNRLGHIYNLTIEVLQSSFASHGADYRIADNASTDDDSNHVLRGRFQGISAAPPGSCPSTNTQ